MTTRYSHKSNSGSRGRTRTGYRRARKATAVVEVIAVTSTTVSRTEFIGLRRLDGGSSCLARDRADGAGLELGAGVGSGTGNT